MCNWRLPLLTEPRKTSPPSLCTAVQSGYPDRSLAHDNPERVCDDLLSVSIVKYVYESGFGSDIAWHDARSALLDGLGCATESLEISSVYVGMIGPIWAGVGAVCNGLKLSGTRSQLDSIRGTFDTGVMVR